MEECHLERGRGAGVLGLEKHEAATVAHRHSFMKPEELAQTAHPFIQGMKPQFLEKLAEFAMQASFEHSEWVFRETELANRFYLILNGLVVIEAQSESGPATVIQGLRGGEVLGWSWLIAPEQWSFSARAVERTDAIFFYGTRLREACEKDPEFGYEILKKVTMVLVDRLQATRRLLLGRKTYSAV